MALAEVLGTRFVKRIWLTLILHFPRQRDYEERWCTNDCAKQTFYLRLRCSDKSYQEAAWMTTARQKRRKYLSTRIGCSVNITSLSS